MAGAFRRRVVLWFVAAVVVLALGPATAGAATASWAFEPASVDFGVLLPGEAAPASAHLELVNTGEVALDAELTTLSFAGEFGLAHNECSGPLAPGGSCAVEVTFRPQSSGPKKATLEVFDGNGKAAPAAARLTGTGMSPTVTIDPSAVDFGTIQAGIPGRLQRTVTVSNQGPGELAIGSIDYSEDPVSSTGELRFYGNALDSPQVVHLSGTATPPPPLTPAPPPPAAPVATLAAHPPKRTKARAATFAFSGNKDTTRFECRLDKSAWRRCASPTSYSSLKPGRHRFWVRPIGTFPTTVLGPALTYGWRVIGPPKRKAHGRRP